MKSVYKDGINGATAVQDYWYAYDSMNRFVVTMGRYTGSDENRGSSAGDTSVGVIVGNEDGVSIGYDAAGQRRLATYGRDGHTERYDFDAMGYLTDTTIDNVLRARRINDTAGRVSQYSEYTAAGVERSRIVHTWDADSLLMEDQDALTGKGTRTFRMADGTVSYTQTYGEETTLKTSFSYDWFDSARQTEVKVQASNETVSKWAPGFSRYVYDEQGRIKLAYDQAGNRGFAYQIDGEGRILQRDELIGGQVDAQGNVANASQNRHHSYYLFDDRQVGNVGNDGIDRIDYAKELAQHEAQAGAKNDQRHKRFTPVAGADFDQNYQPINSLYPTAAPGSYIVQAGDTLQSIAMALWGDSAMWYLLADANGLAPNQPLIANTVLTVPNKVTNIHNNASTFKPYDAGAAMGNTTPTVPEPPPPPAAKKGCGGFVKILAIVVAVVATIFTAGVATIGFGAGFTSIMGAGMATLAGAGGVAFAVGAGALGGAVGSIASQGVLIAGGVQDKFDWKGVALGAVSGAVTAGLSTSGVTSAFAKAGITSAGGQAAARAAIGSVATQGAAMALGVQDSFDWKSVAISAVSAGAGSFVGGKISNFGNARGWNAQATEHLSRFGAGMTAGTVSAAARGNLSSEVLISVGLDVLGNTIGGGIADHVAKQASSSASGSMGSAIAGSQEERVRVSFDAASDQSRSNDINVSLFNASFANDAGIGRHGLDARGIAQEGANDAPIRDWSGDPVVAEYVPEPERSVGIDYLLQKMAIDATMQDYGVPRSIDFGLSKEFQTRRNYGSVGTGVTYMSAGRDMIKYEADRRRTINNIAIFYAGIGEGSPAAWTRMRGGTEDQVETALAYGNPFFARGQGKTARTASPSRPRSGSAIDISEASGGGAKKTANNLQSTRNLLDEPFELDEYLRGGTTDWAFYREIPTLQGPVEIKSKSIVVDDVTLLIDDVHIFPKGDRKLVLGFREVKSTYQSMVDELGRVGFERVTIRGERISGAKFVNNAPNKVQTITLIPRKQTPAGSGE